MKKCSNILEQVCEILCEDINAELCEEIKKHLEMCPKCCAYINSIKKTVHLIKIIEEDVEKVPEDIHRRLHKALKI